MRTCAKNEIGEKDDVIYGVSFVICTNKETNREALGLGLDEGQENDDDVIRAAENAAIRSVVDAGFDFTVESNFQKWHGGPLRYAPVEIEWYAAIEELADEDDDTSWEVTGWEPIWLTGAGKTDVPVEIVDKAQAIRDAAVAAAEKEVEPAEA